MIFFRKVSATWTAIRCLPYFSWPLFFHAFWVGRGTYTVTLTKDSDGTKKVFVVTKGEIKLIGDE